MGTEVDGELDGMGADAAGAGRAVRGWVEGRDAVVADLGEELDLSLAEHVDGLHGVADEKDGATVGVGV